MKWSFCDSRDSETGLLITGVNATSKVNGEEVEISMTHEGLLEIDGLILGDSIEISLEKDDYFPLSTGEIAIFETPEQLMMIPLSPVLKVRLEFVHIPSCFIVFSAVYS